jgi:hypothetical protein
VKQFLTSTFVSVLDVDLQNSLSQFLDTVSDEARSEGWKSARFEVWVGGRSTPTGLYMKYEAKDREGLVVSGGTFVTDPNTVQTLKADETMLLSQTEVQEWHSQSP